MNEDGYKVWFDNENASRHTKENRSNDKPHDFLQIIDFNDYS